MNPKSVSREMSHVRRTVLVAPAALLCACSLINSTAEFADPVDAGQDAAVAAVDAATDAGRDAGEVDAGEVEQDAGVDAGPESRDLLLVCRATEVIGQRGDPVVVDWEAQNVGTVPVSGGRLTVELLQAPMRDGESETWVEVASGGFVSSLDPLEMLSDSVTFVAPDWILSGSNELRCRLQTTPSDDVAANNVVTRTLAVTAVPDLAVTSVTSLGTTASDIVYVAVVTNNGVVAVRDVRWVLLGHAGAVTRNLASGTFTFFARDGFENPMETVVCSGGCPTGPGAITFEVDPDDVIRESDETNNRRTSSGFTW